MIDQGWEINLRFHRLKRFRSFHVLEEKLIKINYFQNPRTKYNMSDSFFNSEASPNYDLPK